MSWAGHISDVENRCSWPVQAELEPAPHLQIQQPNLNCVHTHTLAATCWCSNQRKVYKVNNNMGWLRARGCSHTMPSLFLCLFQWMMPILTLISNSLLAESLQSNEHATVSKYFLTALQLFVWGEWLTDKLSTMIDRWCSHHCFTAPSPLLLTSVLTVQPGTVDRGTGMDAKQCPAADRCSSKMIAIFRVFLLLLLISIFAATNWSIRIASRQKHQTGRTWELFTLWLWTFKV